MKFPQGEGSAVIHRKKNRPALQRHDILTVSLVFFFFIGNLLRSSSTQFLVVLFFIAFCTASFSSKHFHLGLFVRSLFTQLFFLVVLFLLLLSMTAFSHVRAPFSLLCVPFFSSFFVFFFCWAVFHPALSLLVLFSPICWAWIHSPFIAFSARACSLAFLCLAILFLAIYRAVLI